MVIIYNYKNGHTVQWQAGKKNENVSTSISDLKGGSPHTWKNSFAQFFVCLSAQLNVSLPF